MSLTKTVKLYAPRPEVVLWLRSQLDECKREAAACIRLGLRDDADEYLDAADAYAEALRTGRLGPALQVMYADR